jgi:hypothetical protein
MSYIKAESRVGTYLSGLVSTGPSDPSDPKVPKDKHRWYLCLETNVAMTFACQETTKDGALSYTGKARSIAVPIPSWQPKFLDQAILNEAVRPKVRIVQEFKKTNS